MVEGPCAFCGRGREAKVGSIFNGPEAAICQRCMGLCEEVLPAAKQGYGTLKRLTHCSFCLKSYQAVEGRMADGPGVSICEDCLARFKRSHATA